MLAKFSVKNFKNFEKKFTIALSQTKQYAFSEACVKDGIVKTGLIYGPNSIGKSNLGKAIFDIVQNLTDKERTPALYSSYANAKHLELAIEFVYEFVFGSSRVRYEYTKLTYEDIIKEVFFIDGVEVVSRYGDTFHTALEGSETLNSNKLNSKISVMRFIKANAVLADNPTNNVVWSFFSFIDRMLMFSNLRQNYYQGFIVGNPLVDVEIIKKGKLAELESFLNSADVECSLKNLEINGQQKMFFYFGDNHYIDFWENASTGTQSLVFFFYWYMQMQADPSLAPSFVYLDEFDAFYHEKTAAKVVELLRQTHSQVILTTHDSSLLTNELLRPDCAFNMLPEYRDSDSYVMGPLSSRTQKELRQALNIPKMFRAGAFD
ncbi:MAG: ATP-binding protein [Fibrobacteraceae bacterium]|nr:ATP-binding protein [Fibrobacteraceae bacterium]